MDDFLNLVTEFVGDWREFARCMNFMESEIRLIETQVKLHLTTEYASHFMKLFLDRKQDITSWSFWFNLLKKFDDGKVCIENMEASGKVAVNEDDLSKCHFKLVSQKVLDWRRFARIMGYNEKQIEHAQKMFSTEKDRNQFFMETFIQSKNQVSTWEFWKEYLKMFLEGQICIEEIETENTIFVANSNTCVNNIALITEISKHMKNAKELGRLLNFSKIEITEVEKTFTNAEDRCLDLMKKFVNGEQDITSWIFWRNLLSKYEKGKLIIYEVEKSNIRFSRQGSQLADHMFVQSKSGVISHQYDWLRSSPLQLRYDQRIAVNVGAGRQKIMDFIEYNCWLQKKKDYYERFSYFQELNTFDFTGSSSDCEILHNFQELLKDRNDNSVAVKGYSLKNHYYLFQKENPNEETSGTFLVYLENENIFLNINICEKDDDVNESIYKSLESYQYFQAVHDTFKTSNSIFIGVVAYDNAHESFKEFCPTCVNNHLLISKNILKDKNALKKWINDIIHSETVQDIKNQLQRNDTDIENANIGSTVKRDILTFQALQQDEYPSFTMSPESQTSELKKLLFLTQVQIAILITKNKRIVITGGYGSGKSYALMKKIEQVLSLPVEFFSADKDIYYLICHDRQSKFLNVMEKFKRKYPRKTLLCVYPRVALQKMKLSEIISEYTSQTDSSTNVHFFIDEFDGSCFDENEVIKLASVIDQLKNSFIVVGNQSLEKRIFSKDNGFRYKELVEKANFSWFHMDLSMRCSVQINNFIKETTSYLESLTIKQTVKNTYNSSISPVDIEYALEHIPEKRFGSEKAESSYKFNQPDKIGHNVSCENVNLYTYDTSKSHHLYSIYLLLDHIFLSHDDSRFVICLYDESLFSFICGTMQHLCEDWTSDIQDFLHMKRKQILITDYASIRGYEFENFIFVLKMNQKYMKFRYVECFSRATTSLFVIADTAELTDDCDESNMLAVWENSENVSLFKMDYKTETDEYLLFSQSENATNVLKKKNLKLREENFILNTANDAGDGDKYPWSNIHFDDIVEHLGSLYAPLASDDVETFVKNLSKNYQVDFATLLEDDEGLIYNLDYFKGFDPANIFAYFFDNGDTFFDNDIDINREIVLFGSLLHLCICNGSVKSVECLIDKGYQLDVTESERENNVQLPVSPEMISLLEKYGVTKHSIFGKRWLAIACFSNDVQFFEHIVHVNNLNAKTYKICNWYPLLRLALYYKAMKIGELLINKYKVNINEKDVRYQKTVLHQATLTNKIEFAELVLAHGANILVRDKHGNTPYHSAKLEMKSLLDRYQVKMTLAPDLD